jgi:hypothetical protein
VRWSLERNVNSPVFDDALAIASIVRSLRDDYGLSGYECATALERLLDPT